MEGVKSAGGECGEVGGFLGSHCSCWIFSPEPVGTVAWGRTFSYDLIFLIFLSASLRMKRMNCLKGHL